MLKHKIEHRKSGILLYGLTPPKLKHPEDKIQEIAQKQVERLKSLPIDGLVLYDLQDESERTAAERPFPFLETLNPHVYSQQYLQELTVPKIVYKCIGKYSEEYITNWLAETAQSPGFSVFVGTTSKDQQVPLSVNQAHELKRSLNPGLTVGGVTIPERHLKKQDEHLRVFNKVKMVVAFLFHRLCTILKLLKTSFLIIITMQKIIIWKWCPLYSPLHPAVL